MDCCTKYNPGKRSTGNRLRYLLLWWSIYNTIENLINSLIWFWLGIGWAVIRDVKAANAFTYEPQFSTLISHSGGAVGASSLLLIEPEREIVVALITNLESLDSLGITRIVMEVAEQFAKEISVNISQNYNIALWKFSLFTLLSTRITVIPGFNVLKKSFRALYSTCTLSCFWAKLPGCTNTFKPVILWLPGIRLL